MNTLESSKKLHLGCGRKILPGYINIDLYRTEADLQLDITDLRTFADSSVDEVYLNAVFEHLYPFQQQKALSEWHRVLKPGGLLRIDSTPDFDEVVKAYMMKAGGNTRETFDIKEVVRYTHGEYGEDDKDGGIHKDIFTKEKMKNLIEQAGFKVSRIESVCWGSESHPVNINLTAVKKEKTDFAPSKKATFGAVYCVYDDDTWLKESVSSVYEACDAVYFLVGNRPWHGEWSENSATVACINALPDPEHKIRLIRGDWKTETDQRNAGLDILSDAGIGYCFVVDADEIYDPDQLRQMMLFAAEHEQVSCWHMTWDTYWKSYKYVITPREPFTPVVFVKVPAARFAEYRSVGGENHGLIPPEIGFCHHMSYARTDEQILKKITTFSHAKEVRDEWFETVWKQWDSNHALTDLHPTHPSCYQRSARQPFHSLPPVLRECLEKEGGLQTQKNGLVSIVILTFNELKYTRECVESIRKHTPEPHEIIFVDNGSADGTAKWLQKIVRENPNYRMIRNKKNLGFSAGCNQGIEAASGEYILLLNNDVVVTEKWLSGMLECLHSDPDIGIVGPMTNNISGSQKVDADYRTMQQMHEYAGGFRQRNRHRRIPLRRIVGFCMLFRQALVEKIGLFDEDFGSGNFEDDDFCLRAELLGCRNIVAGDVFIHHYGSRSFIGNRIDYGASMSGNRKKFLDKWSGISVQSILGRKLIAVKAHEQAWEFYHKGQIDKAAETLLDGIKHAPDEKAIYVLFAEMLLDNKQFNDAIGVLNEMPLHEFDPKKLLLTGYCKEGLGFYDEAGECTEKVLSVDGSSASALNLKGILAYKHGDRKRAEDFFLKAVEAAPDYGEPFTNLGILKWAAGQYEEALGLLERGFILSPAVTDIVTAYHAAVTASGTFARAEAVFREAKAVYPVNRRIIFLLIDLLLKQEKFEDAMEEIENAMVLFGIDDGMLAAALDVRSKVGLQEIKENLLRKSPLSLCMIVKNEEKNLAKSLMSVKGIVDEMIVVDTGSGDRTKDIATAVGAQVYDFSWTGDFSEARNFSLSKARGDWVLVLDADEMISSGDHHALLQLTAKKGRTTAYSFVTRNYLFPSHMIGWTANDGRYGVEEAGTGWFPSNKVRLFPRDSRVRFVNPVHEVVEPSLIGIGFHISTCNIPVHHYGKLDSEKGRAKAEEYYLLGKKKIAENGDDFNALQELAIQAGELQKFDEAVELWQRVIKLKPGMARAYLNLAALYSEIEKFEEALSSARKAVELEPDMKEAVYNYALCELYTGNGIRTVEVLQKLLKTGPGYPLAQNLLLVAFCCCGKKEQALGMLHELQKTGFDFSQSAKRFANKFISAGQIRYAVLLFDMAIETGNKDEDIITLRQECDQRTTAAGS